MTPGSAGNSPSPLPARESFDEHYLSRQQRDQRRSLPLPGTRCSPFTWIGPAIPPAAIASASRRGGQSRTAREKIADLLDADPDEVIFTSGATEANNLAIFGLSGTTAGTIVASLIEHPCVLEPIRS